MSRSRIKYLINLFEKYYGIRLNEFQKLGLKLFDLKLRIKGVNTR